MIERNTVVLVDDKDKVLGTEEKIAAHKQGLLHRAFSVMLYRKNRNDIEFLLQQRADNKYHCPDLWTNTCCSHPALDQDIVESAKLRLKEELEDIDINNLNLIKVGDFIYKASFDNGLIEHEFDHVFLAEYCDTPSYYNPNEIKELKWLRVAEIDKLYHKSSLSFTPWFKQVFNLCREYIEK